MADMSLTADHQKEATNNNALCQPIESSGGTNLIKPLNYYQWDNLTVFLG